MADASSEEALERYRQGTGTRKVLIIRDNFLEDTYSVSDHVRPGTPGQPRSLKREARLLPHQQEGLEWLERLWIRGAKGALLADDMGLGKTLQCLAFMAWLTELMDGDDRVPRRPMLIVAPVVLLETWKQEYRRFLEPVFGNTYSRPSLPCETYPCSRISSLPTKVWPNYLTRRLLILRPGCQKP